MVQVRPTTKQRRNRLALTSTTSSGADELKTLCKLHVSVCVQSDDTDGTTANEDDVLHQQPNNTRAGSLGTGSKPSPRELSLSSKARYSPALAAKASQSSIFTMNGITFREKLYEEKIRQQKQELKQLHDEHKRLSEIQGKIRELQWACPDLQVSHTHTHSLRFVM